jgi:hypothetical protein
VGVTEQYEYLVGGLLNDANLTPEREQTALNKTAKDGWELISVVEKQYRNSQYTFYYLRRLTGHSQKENRCFDLQFSN